jgi:thiol-disulfide isomerase/thioredoxin
MTRRQPRRSLIGFAVLSLTAAISVAGVMSVSAQQGGPASSADPRVTAALQRGEASLRIRQYDAALDAFTTANGLSNKTSAVALFGMGRAFQGLEAWKSAADACTEALKYVGDDKALEAKLHNQRGLAYNQLAQKPTDKALRDAEAEFRSVLVLTDTIPVAWYNLGIALLRQNRDPEGVVALQAFVESGVKSADVDTAKAMIENPRRARETFAPEFGIASMEGEYVSLKELRGKVVLLDFWGTWCGPCVAATPMLVNIAKAFAKDTRFKMVGISSDTSQDAGKLRDFILAKKMTWTEIHDPTKQKVIRLYDVSSYPTYIVVDGEGVVRQRISGFSPSKTPSDLVDAISSALKALPKEPK